MTEQDIILYVVGSVLVMMLLGGGFIGGMAWIRPRMLLRQRMNEIGILGDGNVGKEKTESRRQRRIQEKVKQLGAKGEKRGFIEGIRDDIMQAGIDLPVPVFFLGSAVLGVLAAFFALVSGINPLAAGPAALVGGLLLPKMFLRSKARGRQKKFTKNFADAIDLIVRGIRSGLPINECFNVVAREFEAPLGEEFRLLVDGQNLGMTMDDLMDRGLRRIPTSEYKFFAIVTQIQRQTGGNLADTLANLSHVLRERKKMRDKAQAMASEAKASAGIIGSLPFIVGTLLFFVNPGYVMLLFTETTGNYLLAFGAFWMFLGSMVMKSMINFKM